MTTMKILFSFIKCKFYSVKNSKGLIVELCFLLMVHFSLVCGLIPVFRCNTYCIYV